VHSYNKTKPAGLKLVYVSKHKQVNNQTGKKPVGKNLIQSFIVENYLNKAVDVYCGGPDIFKGTVENCVNGILTLNNEGKLTHVVIDKIMVIWAQ
jgi:hypothetical protein